MPSVKPDPIGLFDMSTGVMLYYTVSPLPELMAAVHAIFLVFEGPLSVVDSLPTMPIPVYVLGGAADNTSAAILFTGRSPPCSWATGHGRQEHSS